jgi:uncharacterized HAD superfamily protein
MKIGIDFDDCLIDYFPALIKKLNESFETSFTRKDMHSFDLEKVWNVDRDVMLEKISEFYSREHDESIMPVFGALEAINKLKEKNELVIITGRPDSTNDFVKKWIEKHFPDSFNKIIHTNQFFGVHREKSKVAKEEGIEIFIDDNLENVLSVSKEGIVCFLMDTPWNQGEIPLAVERVKSWNEIVMKISK